jgi:hypothetical protein
VGRRCPDRARDALRGLPEAGRGQRRGSDFVGGLFAGLARMPFAIKIRTNTRGAWSQSYPTCSSVVAAPTSELGCSAAKSIFSEYVMSKILSVLIATVAVTCLVTLGARIVSLEKEFVPSVAAQPVKGLADPPQDLKDLLQRTFDDDEFADQGSEGGNRPFFDDFAWQSFIVLNWPAQAGLRGKADLTKKFGDSAAQVVWETWKTGPEIVPADGKATWLAPQKLVQSLC